MSPRRPRLPSRNCTRPLGGRSTRNTGTRSTLSSAPLRRNPHVGPDPRHHHPLTFSHSNPDVWNDIKFPSEAAAEELQSYIGKRLTPQPTKVRADVEVTCFGYEGIDAIKEALRTAEARNTAETQVKCRLVSPPLYV